MDLKTFIIRICVCFILGVFIGLERQWRRKPIGLRTSTLVCLGSFLFVAVSNLLEGDDMTRIAAQVVSGIGFLGAGVILRDGMNVRGLNTAATLWCSAAIGTLTAFGLIIEASIGTLFILFSNIFLRFLSKKIMNFQKQGKKILYSMEIEYLKEREFTVKSMIMEKLDSYHMILINMNSEIKKDEVIIKITFENLVQTSHSIEKIVNMISMEPGVLSINWKQEEQLVDLDDDDDNC